MTTHLDRCPQQPPEQPAQSREPAATHDHPPWVVGAVPITVWRLDDHDESQPATEPGTGFASRLAERLIEVYTSHGETVDLDRARAFYREAVGWQLTEMPGMNYTMVRTVGFTAYVTDTEGNTIGLWQNKSRPNARVRSRGEGRDHAQHDAQARRRRDDERALDRGHRAP